MVIHEIRQRYGRKIQHNSIELHPKIDKYVQHLKEKGEQNDLDDVQTINTIQEYQQAKKPLNYISIIAHAVKETNSLKEKHLKPYSLSIRRLGCNKRFFSDEENKNIIQKSTYNLFTSLIKDDLLHKVNQQIQKTSTPLTKNDLLNKLNLVHNNTNKLNVNYALNVLDVTGHINKLPFDSTKGKNRDYAYLSSNKPMPLPTNNKQYILLKILESGPKSLSHIFSDPKINKVSLQYYSKLYKKMTGIQGAGIVMTPLLDEKLVTFTKTKPKESKSVYIYRLTPQAKKLLKEAQQTGELTEEFRRKLLGTKHYTLSALDKARVKEIQRWAKIKMMEEQLEDRGPQRRQKGTGRFSIAEILGENASYVGLVIDKTGTRPQTLKTAGPDLLKKYLSHITNLEIKTWLTDFLQKEKRL